MVHPSSAAAASRLAADDPTLIVASSASRTDRDAPRSTTNANTSDSVSAVHAPSTSSVSVSVSVQVGEVWNPPRSPRGAPASLLSNQPSQNSCSATSSAVDDDTLDVLSTAVTATLATRPSFEPQLSAGMFVRVGPPRPGAGGGSGSVRSEPPDRAVVRLAPPVPPQRGAVPRGRHGGPEPTAGPRARRIFDVLGEAYHRVWILEPAGGGFRPAQVAAEREHPGLRLLGRRVERRVERRQGGSLLVRRGRILELGPEPTRRLLQGAHPQRIPRIPREFVIRRVSLARPLEPPHERHAHSLGGPREPEQRTRLREDVEVVPLGEDAEPRGG
mmetsp:Transcript_13277/g.57805  ORF Transcript_13277/g.57805 Transcript_13277/m.57805 type:complete len:330 (-) Transcript_13277:245-1234(-)